MQEERQSFQHLKRKDSQQLQNSHSESQIQLKNPQNHASSQTHDQIIRNPLYRNCFSLRQRISNWFGNAIRCRDTQNSFVQNLTQIQKRHAPTLHEDLKRILVDKIVKIKIIQSSRLELDPNIMHPFVKVHVLNKNTGCYLKRDDYSEWPMVYHNQTITYYENIQKKYESSTNDMILPFATTCCDFRTMGTSSGVWNEKFFINYPAEKLINSNTVILFQLLDFNHQALIYKDTENLNVDNFFRIAWAYLRPVGVSKTHIGNSKLELFRYKMNDKNIPETMVKSFIPNVYYEFIWDNHQKYGGNLSVQLNYTNKPKLRFISEQQEYPNHLFEDERLDKKYLQRFGMDKEEKGVDQQKKLNQKLLKFFRNNQVCQIPKQLVYKLQSDKLGCYRGKFVGDKVFAACSTKKNTSIKVYSLESGNQIMCLKGHREMIYSITTTNNEKYLITSGSDHFIRVWQIPDNVGEFIDVDESQSYIKGECLHSAAVYSACGIHYPMKDMMCVISCCFDGYLRLWDVDLSTKICKINKEILINNYQRHSQKVYPTCCTVFESSFFIVGDSYGDIRIFDFSMDSFNIRSLYSHQQLSKDIIIDIKILNKTHILIQSGDNLIRHYEISNNKLKLIDKYIGAQFEQYIIPCAVSPDNKYLLSPSSTGKPCLWDILTGSPISIDHLNLEIKGPLAACDWHPKYNLILLAGFVQLCPIFIYGNILSQSECKLIAARTS